MFKVMRSKFKGFNVKGQRSRSLGQSSRSQRNITYQLYATFGHRYSYKSWPRDLDYPSPNFCRASKSAKFGLILNVARVWAARVWKCSNISQLWNKVGDHRSWPYVLQVWWSSFHAPLRSFLLKTTPSKILRLWCAKSSITLQRIVRFWSNFTRSLNTWYPNDHKSSKSRSHRSRS